MECFCGHCGFLMNAPNTQCDQLECPKCEKRSKNPFYKPTAVQVVYMPLGGHAVYVPPMRHHGGQVVYVPPMRHHGGHVIYTPPMRR